MPRFSDRAGSAEQLALTLPAASPSANVQDVGTPDSCSITRLNSPACTTPTDASPPPSRTADARLRADEWIATPRRRATLISFFMPVVRRFRPFRNTGPRDSPRSQLY